MKKKARDKEIRSIFKFLQQSYAEPNPGILTTALAVFPLPEPACPIIVENISPWVYYLENEDYTQFCKLFFFFFLAFQLTSCIMSASASFGWGEQFLDI